MASVSYLPINEPATITLEIEEWWSPSEDKIKLLLERELVTAAYILKVDETAFSDRYVITFRPRNSRTASAWEQSFAAALEKHGYEPNIIALEAGTTSSVPGGLLGGAKDILTEITDIPAIKETTGTIKWVAAAVIAIAAIAYLPMLTGMGGSIKKGLGGRR